MTSFWIYLEQSPLLFLTITLVAYIIGEKIYEAVGKKPWCHPVLIAVLILMSILWFSDTPYKEYFDGAQFIHFFLGPATVALAVPLYNNIGLLKRYWKPLSIVLIIGSVSASFFAILPAYLAGSDISVMATLAPKSVTTPVAMSISKEIGGIPSITAILVILTGIVGAVTGPTILTLFGITDHIGRGLAMGISAHGIGTARALEINSTEGVFAALGMGLNALITAIWVPIFFNVVMQ